VQREYLSYYKMGAGPFYLFYRPYHLCHLETTYALGRLAIDKRPVFTPRDRRVADVIAIAKEDLPAGTEIERGIGSDHVYGEIEPASAATSRDAVPICLLDQEKGYVTRVTRDVEKDEPLLWQDVEVPDTELLEAYQRQERMLEDRVLGDGQAGTQEVAAE
jgi:predicted homoserine dehydrogenase-like protein